MPPSVVHAFSSTTGFVVNTLVQISSASAIPNRTSRLTVTAEQKGKGAGRGGYPQDEEKASQLKMVADKMDAFFASSDEAAFYAVASPDITLHADLLILDKNVSGADKVKQTLGGYTKNYDYKHENIAHGADIDGSSVFHFWLHQVPILSSSACLPVCCVRLSHCLSPCVHCLSPCVYAGPSVMSLCGLHTCWISVTSLLQSSHMLPQTGLF